MGDSLNGIAELLESKGASPSGKEKWQISTVQSILSNEKYKGDAVINKTYIRDCISKKVMVNNGERPRYYVGNNHPAIIDAVTFGKVQEELARRSGKRKVKGYKDRAGKIFKQICADRPACMRRMQDALSPLYMDGGRQEENSVALH